MKVAIIADSHFDEHKRFDECVRLHTWILEDIRARGVDLVLHAGDVFERKSTPLERQAAFRWFQDLTWIAPVVVVRGNHDAVDDLPLLERLECRNSLTVVQEARVVEVDTAAGACSVAAIAWPRKSALLEASGAVSRDAGEHAAVAALRDVFRGLGDWMADSDVPRIALMHAMVRDSVTSTGQPLVGCDLEVGLEDLALLRADAYFLGHVHKAQAWKIGEAPCLYPGSPRRTAFGELEAKGYTLATFEGHACTHEFVEAPATKMILIEDEWGDSGWLAGAHGLPDSCQGCELRFRYHVASDQRDPARTAAELRRGDWLNEGALVVKVEEVVEVEQRSRGAEVTAALTLEQKLEVLWRAKGFEPGERREALLAKARRIEEGSHAA